MPKGRRSDYAYQHNPGSFISTKPLPRRMQEALDEADALTQRGNPLAARQVLEDLDRQYPNREEVLTDLVNLNIELNDWANLIVTCERLIKIAPRIPEVQMTLGGAYLHSSYPASALRQYRHFLKLFPNDAQASDMRATVADLEPVVTKMLQEQGFEGAEGEALAEKHEQAQMALAQGNLAQGRRLCEEIIRIRPNFISAHNNLSLLHYSDGNFERAIATATHVLELDPENLHALGNLTRFYCLSGQVQTARDMAERLRVLQRVDNDDLPIKKAEAFSFLGDDRTVLDVALAAEASKLSHEVGIPSVALLWHLGGVAAMHLGDETTAKRLWKRALSVSPGFGLAQENLDELVLPLAERHNAWPFTLGYWLRRPAMDALIAETTAAARKQADSDSEEEQHLAKAMQRVLTKFPELETLSPILLERGDPQGCKLALMMVKISKTPAMQKALLDFALSPFGPDKMRMEAGQAAREAKLLPPDSTRMWVNGQWQEIILMGFSITSEPAETKHSPKVQALAEEAHHALYDEKADEAEVILKEALALEPDSPDLLNNLSKAYELQGRITESRTLINDTHQRFPDYLFAAAALAATHAQEGRIEEARALLNPLMTRSEFHISEYAALCMAEVELALAQGQPQTALTWVDMLERAAPDHPVIDHLRERLVPPSSRDTLLGRLQRMLGRSK